jgi:hypothetical protein
MTPDNRRACFSARRVDFRSTRPSVPDERQMDGNPIPRPQTVDACMTWMSCIPWMPGMSISAKRRDISLGYKLLHTSNGERRQPSVDNNIFYIGFSILK